LTNYIAVIYSKYRRLVMEPIKKPPGWEARFLTVLSVIGSAASIAGFILALIMLLRS
jgi:hypothetical protein